MLSIPQGLTEEAFAALSAKVLAAVVSMGENVQVHGRRSEGTAGPDSDLDIAIRVTPERFEEILCTRFGVPNPDSAKAKTMQHARETGKIQAGEAGLRSLRKELEADLKMEVDISVIRTGGLFDKGLYIPLKKA
jgi:predicted nucleotidyltransferase